MTHDRGYLRSPLVPILVTLLAAAAWFGYAAFTDPAPRAMPISEAQQPFFVEAAEAVPSDSAEDWAAAADVVVTGTVVKEKKLAPPKSETEVGLNQVLIGRTVTLKVSEVLWRSPHARVAVPKTVTMNAFGWAQNDEGTREVTIAGSSRLEVGHQYVLALVWQAAQCADGDRVPAAWTWIGSGGIIPADGDVLGAGEFEGSAAGADETRRATDPGGIKAANLGRTPASVKDDLKNVGSAKRTWPALDNACS